MPSFDRFDGCIAGAAFASGDSVVVGSWRSSPFGRFIDVMWVQPDGTRVLLAPAPDVAAYVQRVYSFDRVDVVRVTGGWDGAAVAVEAGRVRVRVLGAARDARSWLFAARPRALRQSPAWVTFEDLVARPLVGRVIGGAAGVRAAGVTPGGRREYYGVADYRGVVEASLQVDGRDAGQMRDLPARLGIGLSSFPRRPAIVHVTTTVQR